MGRTYEGSNRALAVERAILGTGGQTGPLAIVPRNRGRVPVSFGDS